MLPVVWFSRKSACRNYTLAYKNASALSTGWHPVQIKEEVMANKEIKVTVLYDFFPARYALCAAYNAETQDDSKAGVTFSLWALFTVVLVQF